MFSKSISKNEIPDTLKIHVEADVLTERDSYSLGIRITPDTGYIKNLREEAQAKLNSLTPAITPLITIFNYLEDPNNSKQFDNGFNLLDTRIAATGVPENGSERAVGYNDPLRTFYSYRIDNKKIGFKLSETIDLKNIKSSIGSDVYNIGKIIFKNVSRFDKAKPIVNIYIPVNDSQSEKFGEYERIELGKVDKKTFNGKINDLKSRIVPGTIIEYDFPGEQPDKNNNFSMKMTLDERKVFIDNLYEYQKTSGDVEAKFINVGNKKEQYRVGKYVFETIFNTDEYKGPVIFKVLENGEDGFCINPHIPNPTNIGNHHSKIVFGNKPTYEELKALHDAFNMKKNAPDFDAKTTKEKLDKFKKIFYCYDRYIRENNLDPINDEEVRYVVRDAKQAAIFDVVNGSGREFLEKGYPSEGGREVYTSGQKTIAFYEKLNSYIEKYPDLTEDQLNSVTITLYPIDAGNFQNIITGRVKNPVYIEKRDQNGDALSGAKFQITRKYSKRIVAEWTSNMGPQELYLDPGEYTLKEVEAPNGYDKIDDVDFTVEEKITEKNIRVSRLNGTNDELFDSTEIYKDLVISKNSDVPDVNQPNKYMFTVINKKHGFKIKKVDAGDNKLLGNAEFTLYDKDNKEVKKVLTDAKGIAEFTGLEPGTYILKETQAPEGYNTNDKPVYVNIPEEGEITFSNFQDKIELDSTIFTSIKEEDITKKAPVFDGIIGREEQLNIIEHDDYHDFMNLKTNLISADQSTVKTRIFLNPSTDPINGMGPNRNTILTLSKNNANSVDYKVYKILKSEKASITEEQLLKKTPVVNGSINNNRTDADIDFKTYGTYATPDSTDEKRWQGDSYIVDITSYYIGKSDLSDETREIGYNWKYINSSGKMETYMDGTVGATVKFKEEDVIVKEGDTVLEVKNSKVGKFVIQKVDADDENKRLKGAEFTLYEFSSSEEAERKVVKTVTTEGDGLAEFKELKPGKYILEETKVPDGYSKIDSKLIVEVGENGEVKFSNIDDYKDIFTKTTTITKKEPKLTINRQDHNQNLIQTEKYPAFMNLTAKVIDADEKSMTSRIYLNSLNTNEGYGPNRLTNLELSSPNSTGIKTTVYKVPFDNKGSIKDIDNYISVTDPKPIAKDLRQGSSDEVVKFNCDGQNRWHGSAYVVDVETTYDAIDPKVDATANITRTLKYYWYNLDDTVSWIDQNISSDVSVTKKMEDIEYEDTCVLKVKNSKGTNFKILKVDANAETKHLPGAEFTLYDETGSKEIQKAVTDENGIAEFKGVGVGKYVVAETKAPAGYDKSDKTWHIEVVNEDGKYKVFLYGKPTQEISGYRFNHTEPYKTEFTDFNGINYLNVITELKRAENKEGFYLNITLEKNYNYRNYYTGNYIPYTGKLSLKFDNNNFEIYDASSNQPLNNNPVVINAFDCQSYGNPNVYEMNYYIRIKKIFNVESGPLTSVRFDTNYSGWYNYVLDEAIPKLVPVYKTNDNKTELKNSKEISFTVKNEPIKRNVEFVKVNSEGNVLPGAKFRLLKNNNGKFNVVEKEGITSGNGGKIQIKDLEVGEYRLEETEAPSNYTQLKGTAIQFRITEDGKTEVYFKGNYTDINDINNKIVNYKKGTGSFKLKKVDDEEVNLEGVKFTLTNKKNPNEKIEKSTDENGEINFQGLKPGEYTLEEIETLSGYKKSEYTWTVTVYDTGYTVVKANPLKIDEKIHTPSDVGEKLTVSNFEFKVKDKPNTEKIILPNRNQFFEFSYTLEPTEYGDNGIKEGDFFTTKYSPFIKRQGTIETFIPDDIIIDQGLLAIANYDEKTETATYTFTKLIEDLPKEVSFSIKESLNVNRETVPFDNKEDIEFINNVAGKNLNCGKYKVSYKLYGDESLENAAYVRKAGYFLVGGTNLSSTVSISSFINNINYKTSKVNFVSYINFNNLNPNNFKIVLSNMQGAIINSQKSDIKVYKVISGNPSQSFSSIYNANNLTFNKEVDTTINYANNLNLAEIKINDFSENSRYIIELNTPFDSINDFAKIKARVDCDNPPYCFNTYVETFSHIVTKPNETSGEGGVISPDLIVVNQKVKHPDIEFKKIDGKDKDKKVLEGAEFTLYKAEKDGKDKSELKFGMVNKDFEIVTDEKNAYTVTSDKEGKFKFEKLEDGIYAIKETKAPKDYALLTKYAFFFKVEGGKITQVDETGNVVKVDGKDHVVVDITLEEPTNEVIQIENFKAEYPSTGGVGALPFVFIGMMIMMVGAYMFIRRRDALYE